MVALLCSGIESEQNLRDDSFVCLVAVSMFNVIQFPNDECEGDTGKNGTCYTGEVEME